MAFSIQEILGWVQGEVVDPNLVDQRKVERISPLGVAQPTHLAFFISRAFEGELQTTNPGILITAKSFLEPLIQTGLPSLKSAVVITSPDPYLALAVLSEKFAAESSSVAHLPEQRRGKKTVIHPTAVVASTAQIGEGVEIGPYCVIAEGARIGAYTVLYPHCSVGPQCQIGEHTVLFSQVTLYEWTQVGSRVRIHSGTVIGSDGFGYAPRKGTNQRIEGHQKIYHLGNVVIEDDVEIGANVCVDRGTFGETRIGRFAKIDNLVQVGHNVRLDFGAIICGSTALAGHSQIGKFAYIGGNTGITNHVHVGDGAKVAACSLVSKDIPAGKTAVGNPQREHHEHFRVHALLSKLLLERRKNSNG